MQENPYQPPSAAFDELPLPVGMSGMTPKEVQRLYYRSTNVNAIAGLLTFAVIMLAIALVSSQQLPEEFIDRGLVLGMLIFYAFAAVGLIRRTSWGRILGIISCVISLPAVPLGTIVGVLGLVAFFRAKILFGTGRVTHREVKLAYKELRAAKRLPFMSLY